MKKALQRAMLCPCGNPKILAHGDRHSADYEPAHLALCVVRGVDLIRNLISATTTEVASSHVVMLSQPQVVIDVIRKAVKAAQGETAAA